MISSVSELVSSVSALIIIGTFCWAAVAKLRNRIATNTAFKTLRLPAPKLLSAVVPLVEVGIGATMIFQQRFGAALAIVLLGIFTAFLVGKLRSGSAVSCGCFGSAQTTPVSWVTIGRNVVLITLGGIALTIQPTVAFVDRTTSLHIALLTTAVTVTLIGALIISVLTMKQELS
jgi:hypothetical protein